MADQPYVHQGGAHISQPEQSAKQGTHRAAAAAKEHCRWIRPDTSVHYQEPVEASTVLRVMNRKP
jgi:hypothetical protein